MRQKICSQMPLLEGMMSHSPKNQRPSLIRRFGIPLEADKSFWHQGSVLYPAQSLVSLSMEKSIFVRCRLICVRDAMDVMGVVGSEECLRTMKLFISNPVWGCWVDSLADVSEEVSGDGYLDKASTIVLSWPFS